MSDVGSPRQRLPTRRASWTQRFRVGGQPVYLTAGEYDDGTLGEIFIDVSRAGTMARELLSALAITLSIALQHGVPLETLIDALDGSDFAPAGPVLGSETVHEARSIIDAILQELRAAYLAPAEASS